MNISTKQKQRHGDRLVVAKGDGREEGRTERSMALTLELMLDFITHWLAFYWQQSLSFGFFV